MMIWRFIFVELNLWRNGKSGRYMESFALANITLDATDYCALLKSFAISPVKFEIPDHRGWWWGEREVPIRRYYVTCRYSRRNTTLDAHCNQLSGGGGGGGGMRDPLIYASVLRARVLQYRRLGRRTMLHLCAHATWHRSAFMYVHANAILPVDSHSDFAGFMLAAELFAPLIDAQRDVSLCPKLDSESYVIIREEIGGVKCNVHLSLLLPRKNNSVLCEIFFRVFFVQ